MVKAILKGAEERMQGAVHAIKKEFAAVRTGRANPSILDRVTVEYYGTETPLNQLANISTPEARMIVITPWDKGAMGNIEKAILKSDLGLNPSNDGNIIRLAIPHLTEERRKELVRLVKKEAEEGRVAVRNVRRDANDHLKKIEKSGDVSEDESRRAQDEVQQLTDKYIAEIDHLLTQKEAEIMEV